MKIDGLCKKTVRALPEHKKVFYYILYRNCEKRSEKYINKKVYLSWYLPIIKFPFNKTARIIFREGIERLIDKKILMIEKRSNYFWDVYCALKHNEVTK